MNILNQKSEEGTIVICGSMTHYTAMLEFQKFLQSHNVRAIVPEEERELIFKGLNEEEYTAKKGTVSEKYFRIIRQRKVFGILVVNNKKGDRENYIGANTFAEIAIAVNAKKKVYLLNDIYEPVKEELLAWRAVPLLGRIDQLIKDVTDACREKEKQLELDLGEPR